MCELAGRCDIPFYVRLNALRTSLPMSGQTSDIQYPSSSNRSTAISFTAFTLASLPLDFAQIARASWTKRVIATAS